MGVIYYQYCTMLSCQLCMHKYNFWGLGGNGIILYSKHPFFARYSIVLHTNLTLLHIVPVTYEGMIQNNSRHGYCREVIFSFTNRSWIFFCQIISFLYCIDISKWVSIEDQTEKIINIPIAFLSMIAQLLEDYLL